MCGHHQLQTGWSDLRVAKSKVSSVQWRSSGGLVRVLVLLGRQLRNPSPGYMCHGFSGGQVAALCDPLFLLNVMGNVAPPPFAV